MPHRRRSVLVFAGVGFALAVGWSLTPAVSSAPDVSRAPAPDGSAGTPVRSVSFDAAPRPPSLAAVIADAARISDRLTRVERRLRARNPAGLSDRQLRHRRKALDHLREYRTRGVFPVNADFAGRRAPYFVDRNATLCALAYLIWQSGSRNLVTEIVATHNNGSVRDLASNPRLRAWLREHGLTTGEASMIQPAYGGRDCVACITPTRSTVGEGFVIASVLGSGLSVWSGLSNASDPSDDGAGFRTLGALGGLAGGATAALGATRFDTEGASLALGIADAAIGAAAAAAGVANLFSGGGRGSDRPSGEGDEGSSGLTLSLDPYAATPRGVRPGLGVSVRY